MKILGLFTIGINLLTGSFAFAENYTGSSFNETWDVILNKNFLPKTEVEKSEFKVYSNNKLPQYPVNFFGLFAHGDKELKKDAIRTINEKHDFYDRLPKRLHSNGVCVAGQWKITKPTQYTGYFTKESNGLFIGRISVALEDTTSGDDRGFGFAGKLFPTLNPDQVESTGNFFTVDVLTGSRLDHVLDAQTTNEPKVNLSLGIIPMIFKISTALKAGDENPAFRPLTQVANLGLESQALVKQPHWIRLTADSKIKRNNQADFRNEILVAMKENKILRYNIDVSDTTSDRTATTGWTTIGEINLDRAQVSYGCDRRLHFSHPKIK